MSMSTGDIRRPSSNKSAQAAVAAGAKDDVIDSDTPASATTEPKSEGRPGAKTAAKASTRSNRPGVKPPTGRPPAKAGGGKSRKPLKTVKVSQGRNWGPIGMFGGAGVVAVLIIGFGAYALISRPDPSKWAERAGKIDGIQNYLVSNPDYFKIDPKTGSHKVGALQYPTSPPVGGYHNPYWQNCMGDVYPAEVPKEQATHSMEHGAVWIAYKPDLPKAQVDQLASKVNGKSFMLMSPYPGLDRPISVQAWGYQLKLDNANDGRIDDFISDLRQNATQEPQATCSGGITDTGKEPLNLTPPNTGTGTGAGTGSGG
jgi:hypothetical protein